MMTFAVSCLAFNAPLRSTGSRELGLHDVDWREMGLVSGLKRPLRPLATAETLIGEEEAMVVQLGDKESIAWEELGCVREVKMMHCAAPPQPAPAPEPTRMRKKL